MLFSMFIVVYLFLGGCAAGLLLVSSGRNLLFRLRYKASSSNAEIVAFERLTGQCYLIALLLTLASIACLFFDLKSPMRVLLLLTHPTLTPISIGAYVLLATVVVLGLLVFAHYFAWNAKPRWRTIARVTEYLAIPVALALMSYTGVFLALVKSVPLWNTWLTVLLFVLSACSAGYALVAIIQNVSAFGPRIADSIVSTHRNHAVIIGVEMVALIAFAVNALLRPEAAVQKSIRLVMEQSMLDWVLGGVLLLGMLFPLLMSISLHRTETRKRLAYGPATRFYMPADLACLLGCFLLRYCLVAAGVH